MKLGTFVMGGLAGAALCMMMQRNRSMSAIADGMGQMFKQRMNDVKENAIQKGIDLKFSNGFMGTSSGNNQNHKNNNSKSGSNSKNGSNSASFKSETEGLDEVEHIASKDPHVKHEINDILEQNGQHRI